jgi:hypothetical protein
VVKLVHSNKIHVTAATANAAPHATSTSTAASQQAVDCNWSDLLEKLSEPPNDDAKNEVVDNVAQTEGGDVSILPQLHP